MGKHVVVGAGPIGTAVAGLLVTAGHDVSVVTRRGTQVAGATAVAANASDAAVLSRHAAGADALYNCANPPQYHTWPEIWPPLAAALLSAAESSGAVLATMSCLYGYGPVTVPMTEEMPLVATTVKGGIRAKMWHDALALHQAGRIRATEVRASDYLGYRVNGFLGDVVLTRTANGRTGYALGDPGQPHSWTTIGDAANALVIAAATESAWGHAWHAPTAPAISMRAAAERANELIGAPRPTVREVPRPVLWSAGIVVPMARAMREMQYQFQRPFILDSSHTERTFGIAPTPLDESLRKTAELYRSAPR
ncbi:nucleoside-diphosphate-sugar epimerase [Allocatelliglobosispora scoriae]|uniref:Nucleoside-diphosphate-sugar epimerase n=1 Tax=Allocatelliglobosispora scoriae TaxID=643052 RepID=A0A841BRG8_9ACTN|nr:NAD-dependent epimerase/dehydratase family protein [Allocatelliglobosispora scoriae]MBB5871647.1 nucleoside-diphosphate-sugar epimerase [Allocatelliglobosispora scoriae]